MSGDSQSLRWAVDKWLTPWQSSSLRVARVAGTKALERCVRIEVRRPQGLLTLFFFRHDDGAWRVFPQSHKSHAAPEIYRSSGM
ncbi:hypothetical protein [Paraburkholderia oxyphila]|uniref:hypothetical protein n=1 Tax=Paraburkholderia oxyphila TaxID=614212 RepID=UPI000A0756FB|nr:hypothetical protein [Paraburkholderia oxyphila]